MADNTYNIAALPHSLFACFRFQTTQSWVH